MHKDLKTSFNHSYKKCLRTSMESKCTHIEFIDLLDIYSHIKMLC